MTRRAGGLRWRVPGVLPVVVGAGVLLSAARAQTVSTVRESEFRTRWVDQQVDRPQEGTAEGVAKEESEATGALRAANALRALFRNAPVALRVSLSTGYEYSNQQTLTARTVQPSKSSFFVAPAVGIFYGREVGPWLVSARYSGGYLYYFDRDYVAAGPNGGIPSQTAALDVALQYSRLNLRSNAAASYGSGFDIERNRQTDRLMFTELLGVDYQLTEYTRAGLAGTAAYESDSGSVSGMDDSTKRYTGAFYTDYFLTGKTRLRVEVSAGHESQSIGAGIPVTRDFYQGQLRMSFQPASKLSLEAGIGLGVVSSTGTGTMDRDGLRTVYSLTATYVPTEKISAQLYVGLETTASEPEFSLALDWRPRDNTAFRLSIYQLSGISTVSLAQNRLSRGFLVSARQRFFQRANVSLLGGWEEYEDVGSIQTTIARDPYYFLSTTVAYEFSRWLALEALYRSSTRQTGVAGSGSKLETRASLSLRLTF